MELTPYTGPGFASCKPDHTRVVNEGPPSMMLGHHPAFTGANLGMPSKQEIGDFYRKFTGKEPPTREEWEARFKDKGKPIPPYARDHDDA